MLHRRVSKGARNLPTVIPANAGIQGLRSIRPSNSEQLLMAVRLELTRTSVLFSHARTGLQASPYSQHTQGRANDHQNETPVSYFAPRCLTTDTTRETPGVPFSAEVSHSPDRDGTQWDGIGQISRPTTSYPLQGPCRTTPTLDAPRLRSPHNGSHITPRVRSQSSPSLNHPNPGSDTPIAGAVPL